MSMSACRPVGARAFFAHNPGLTPRAIAFRPVGAFKGAGTFLSPKEFQTTHEGTGMSPLLWPSAWPSFDFTGGTLTNAANSDSKSICENL